MLSIFYRLTFGPSILVCEKVANFAHQKVTYSKRGKKSGTSHKYTFGLFGKNGICRLHVSINVCVCAKLPRKIAFRIEKEKERTNDCEIAPWNRCYYLNLSSTQQKNPHKAIGSQVFRKICVFFERTVYLWAESSLSTNWDVEKFIINKYIIGIREQIAK